MAPIKFEEHVKEKLDEREIQPSEGSWGKLDSRLNNSKKSSGNKWWVSAVAAVVVLLIAGLFFIDLQKENSTPIVETPVEEVKNTSDKIDFEQPEELASEETKEEKDEIMTVKNIKNTPQKSEEFVAENQDSKPGINSEKANQTSQPKRKYIAPTEIRQTTIAETESGEFHNKVQEVVAQISQVEKSSEEYTEAEVDALLVEAAREISKSQAAYNSASVSADALLTDVEHEVDQSFRKEVFDFLKEEFLKAKTAVATRND